MSCVDLNPQGFLGSNALGISETQQVGWGWPDAQSHDHALLWYGTAECYVDLHPTNGLFYTSVAKGVGGSQQVGGGEAYDSGKWHAFLWTSTADSCIDLNPSGLDSCMAQATNGTQQVGYGAGESTSNSDHALLWNGTADSYVDLHEFLPGSFSDSRAIAIDATGNILGYADRIDGWHLTRRVIMWQVPEPCSGALLLIGSLALLRRCMRRHFA